VTAGPRALVIQTAFLGDVVLTTPLFRALKERWLASHVAALVIPETAPILERLPWLDEVLVHDKRAGGLRELARRRLRRRRRLASPLGALERHRLAIRRAAAPRLPRERVIVLLHGARPAPRGPTRKRTDTRARGSGRHNRRRRETFPGPHRRRAGGRAEGRGGETFRRNLAVVRMADEALEGGR